MQLLAIDPGTTESAWVWLDEDGSLVAFKKESNETFLTFLRGNSTLPRQCVIEMVLWAGRFAEAHKNAGFLYRQDVKLNLCKSTKANDASIRQALIDRFGPGKEKALGTKKAPGPLYGVTKDVWAALALAVTWNDTRAQRAG
jgi:hypothetical protein